MISTRRLLTCIGALAALALAAWWVTPARGYVEAPMSLGAIVAQSSNIVLMRVEKVDREKNLIFYRKVRDIKGQHPQESIKHNIGRGGLRPNEWKPQMDWAEPGKMAVFFHNGGASETCVGTWWYQAYGGGEWWNHSHAEPFLLRSFAGNPEKLAAIAADMVAGKETVAPCMVDGNKDDLHNRRAKIQRLKVSLKLQDYNPKRDFVGWGGEDFRRLTGMPGFTHYSAISRVDPEAQAISAADFDGDGKTDLCLVGAGRVTLLHNGGESLNEASLPESVGARAAVWADYNGDGKADLLLATALGPRLYTNQGGGGFKDDSRLLPQSGLGGAAAAAWLDADGDGWPDVLLAHGYHGLRLYRNLGKETAPAAPAKQGKWFEDVSVKAGLGSGGIGGGLKGDTLTVCDVNGDGRPDVLYGAGKGMLLLNARGQDGGASFAEAKDSGIAYQSGKAGPVFGDYDHDGHADLFVPQKGQCKLFKGDGKGKFTDVTDKAGALAQPLGWAACAAWADLDNDGHLDLIIGCLRGPNRFFRNKGDGTFTDATESIGLHQRVFNTQAVALADLNADGALDLILNNEGQESAVLLGNPEGSGKRVPVTVQVSGKGGVVGSRVQITDKAGKAVRSQEISGGSGRGGQPAPVAHFALEPGAYRVLVRYSSGVTRGREITVASSPLRSLIDDQAPQVD